MEKKYQVFISSTYEDLKEERKNVTETLLMMDCIPAGMEAFCAADEEQFEYIKKVIDLCDYYVLIIGKRYGSISPITGKSYTEMEYDYAKAKNIPVLVFPVNNNVKMQEDEYKAELKAFRQKAYGKTMGATWRNADELGKKVAISLEKAIKKNDRPGWIRLDEGESFGNIVSSVHNDTEITDLPFRYEKIIIPYRDSVLSDLFSDGSKETTWGELFDIIAPMLTEQVTSSQVANKILMFATRENASEFILLNNFEHRFLNRLVSAGYVQKESTRSKTYYTLTDSGLKLVDKLCATCA